MSTKDDLRIARQSLRDRRNSERAAQFAEHDANRLLKKGDGWILLRLLKCMIRTSQESSGRRRRYDSRSRLLNTLDLEFFAARYGEERRSIQPENFVVRMVSATEFTLLWDGWRRALMIKYDGNNVYLLKATGRLQNGAAAHYTRRQAVPGRSGTRLAI